MQPLILKKFEKTFDNTTAYYQGGCNNISTKTGNKEVIIHAVCFFLYIEVEDYKTDHSKVKFERKNEKKHTNKRGSDSKFNETQQSCLVCSAERSTINMSDS
jgi:hypothetical protein